MAEANDTLLQFDGVQIDVNENFSNETTKSSSDLSHLESFPPKSNIQCDSTFIEINSSDPSNSNEMPENTELMSENSTQPQSNNLDILSQNMNEVNTSSRNSDSGIHDSENNVVDNTKLIDFAGDDLNLSDNCGLMISDFSTEESNTHFKDDEFKDEEFRDAAQFFQDPSSLVFLENAGSSNSSEEPLMARSSLYMNFDPLHAKFYSHSSVKSNELQEIAENEAEPEDFSADVQNNMLPEIVNKHLINVSPRQSLGNVLISFDSPVGNKDSAFQPPEDEKFCEPQKLYTEEELQQALKIQELSVQDTFLKKQHDLEVSRSQKQEELEAKLEEQKCLSFALHCALKEVFDTFSERDIVLQDKLKNTEIENDKLKKDLKTSEEDLLSLENTFSDFHKRYENCKDMLKVYTQNENNYKQQLENMKVQVCEKEEMYKVLQTRTQEMLDKANTEVTNAKKAGDAQVAVLKAQLKKAELKISSLESDVKHVKIENDKLSSICDELMAKVSET